MTEDDAYEAMVAQYAAPIVEILESKGTTWWFTAEIVRELRKKFPEVSDLTARVEYVLSALAADERIQRDDMPDPDPDHTFERLLANPASAGYAVRTIMMGDTFVLHRYRR